MPTTMIGAGRRGDGLQRKTSHSGLSARLQRHFWPSHPRQPSCRPDGGKAGTGKGDIARGYEFSRHAVQFFNVSTTRDHGCANSALVSSVNLIGSIRSAPRRARQRRSDKSACVGGLVLRRRRIGEAPWRPCLLLLHIKLLALSTTTVTIPCTLSRHGRSTAFQAVNGTGGYHGMLPPQATARIWRRLANGGLRRKADLKAWGLKWRTSG